MELALQVTIGIFMAGIIFQSGRLSTRVDKLEEWRGEMRAQFEALHGHLLRLEDTMLRRQP